MGCIEFIVCMAMFVVRLDTAVVDVGPPAEWVKINVQRTVSFQILVWIKLLSFQELKS